MAAVVAFNPNIKQIGAAMSKSIIATVYGNSDFVSFNSFVSVFLILRTSAIIIIPIPAPTQRKPAIKVGGMQSSNIFENGALTAYNAAASIANAYAFFHI